MKDAQATMTGRSWRHFSSYWPFIVAGALGPADAAASSESGMDGDDVAPVSSTLALVAPLSHAGSDDDGSEFSHDPDAGDVPNQSRGIGSSLPGPNVVTTDRYRDVFGDMPLHDAILELFCRTAQLGGDFFGDNVADTAVMPEELIKRMDARAKALGVDCLQTLYGHTNTSKVHRIIHHMDEELRGRGNLWEGDTSENEKLHGSCKRMFRRSNKRGPTVALQMMRCDEAQSAVLREVVEADAGCSPRASTSASPTNDDEATIAAPPTLTEQLSFSGRGEREFVGNLRLSPALAKIGALLGLADNAWVTVHRTARIVARFEWGAPPTVQSVRAAASFMGKPWFSFLRYEARDGAVCWGRARLVLRSLGRTRRSCVVIQRMRRVDPRPGCVLTRFGCMRLTWHFDSAADEYPGLEVVDATRILREEDVQVDWFDLSDRLGLFATPANKRITAAERRDARYFTNVFYPWTSRSMRPGF